MNEIPVGYCQCGCGKKTSLASQTRTKCGYKKGEPFRFIAGHSQRVYRKYKTDEQLKKYVIPDKKSDCWLWQGCTDRHGYGVLKSNGKRYPAHRYYYKFYRNPIPKGLQIDHLCRNPLCVNPDHLEPVTQTENLRRGIRVKLTMDDVREIRLWRKSKDVTSGQIAEAYGVSIHNVYQIVQNHSWREEL